MGAGQPDAGVVDGQYGSMSLRREGARTGWARCSRRCLPDCSSAGYREDRTLTCPFAHSPILPMWPMIRRVPRSRCLGVEPQRVSGTATTRLPSAGTRQARAVRSPATAGCPATLRTEVPAVLLALPPLADVHRHLQAGEPAAARRRAVRHPAHRHVVRRVHRADVVDLWLVVQVARAVGRRSRNGRDPDRVAQVRRERDRRAPVVVQRFDRGLVPEVMVPRVRAVVGREPPQRPTGPEGGIPECCGSGA